jgi:dynactin complex subunit
VFLFAALKPFAELSIVQRIMPHSNVQQFKYFKVLIQEFHVKVDMGFINALLEMFQSEKVSETEEVSMLSIQVLLFIMEFVNLTVSTLLEILGPYPGCLEGSCDVEH